jgi:hypothetical protein
VCCRRTKRRRRWKRRSPKGRSILLRLVEVRDARGFAPGILLWAFEDDGLSRLVMPGLVPGIHVGRLPCPVGSVLARRGWQGCPAMAERAVPMQHELSPMVPGFSNNPSVSAQSKFARISRRGACNTRPHGHQMDRGEFEWGRKGEGRFPLPPAMIGSQSAATTVGPYDVNSDDGRRCEASCASNYRSSASPSSSAGNGTSLYISASTRSTPISGIESVSPSVSA